MAESADAQPLCLTGARCPNAMATQALTRCDAELMRRAREGDRVAFGELVERYRDGLVNYLARMSGNLDDAQDLAQEAFVRLFQAAATYREQGQLQAFLYRIATNLLRSQRRKARRRKWVPFEGQRDKSSADPSPQDAALGAEMVLRVDQALREIPERFRAPLVLHVIEEWPLARIAETLGCRLGTVKSRISRARRDLRRLLAEPREGGTS